MHLTAARDAVACPALLKPAGAPAIVTLLTDLAGKKPRTAGRSDARSASSCPTRKSDGPGIRANAFFNRQSLGELAETGFADPHWAHDTTLLRATLVMVRHRNAVSYRKVMKEHPRVPMTVR